MHLRNTLSAGLAGAFLGALQVQAVGDILTTQGFSTCADNGGDLSVSRFNVQYDRATMQVTFDVAGESKKEQKVQATLSVTAYGRDLYTRSFDPCDENIEFLCPVPVGNFSAAGTLPIPSEFASQIPAIAFQIPDLDGIAKLTLTPSDNNTSGDTGTLACLQSSVVNGKTTDQPAVQYVTLGVAGVALVLSGVSVIGAGAAGALGAGGGAGAHTTGSSGPSPNMVDVVMWFQSIATTGMLSVDYPPIYRAFTKNFAWSTGLVSWEGLQKSIDSFRSKTGGNLTTSSVEEINNTTFLYTSTNATSKRSVIYDWAVPELAKRLDITTSINGTTSGSGNLNTTTEDGGNKIIQYVDGIQRYAVQLAIPSSNMFLTVLLIFCIVLASIAVLILLFKLILELWALCGNLSKPLQGFRKRYWGFLAGTMLRIILIVYGIWTIYCLYQFKRGDSWAAHLLAALTLGFFTAILAFFATRIIILAKRAKRLEGNPDQLFQDKKNLRRYGLFYDQYKSTFWWMFIPFIIYLFVKGAFVALAEGHGLIQSSGQIGCEVALLIVLVIGRPFNTTAGNVINICISVARVLSVVGVLIFTVELNITPTTKTVTGVVLIAVQGVVTAALAILILVNAIRVCCQQNPHVAKRKAHEKLLEEGERDTLTPLDPLDPRASTVPSMSFQKGFGARDGLGQYQTTPTHDGFPMESIEAYRQAPTMYDPVRSHEGAVASTPMYGTGARFGERSASPPISLYDNRPLRVMNDSAVNSQDNLVRTAAPMARVPIQHQRQQSDFNGYNAYQGERGF